MAAAGNLESLWTEACTKFQEDNNCSLPQYVNKAPVTSTIEEILTAAESDFTGFREANDLRSTLKTLATVVGSISNVLGHGLKLIYPPAEVVTAAVIVIVKGTQKVSKDYNALKDLLADLHHILARAQVYAGLAQCDQINQVIIDCLVQLLEILGLVAKAVKPKARARAFLKTFVREDSKIQEAFQKLDYLSKREGQAVNLAILSTTNALLKDIHESIAMEKNHSDTTQMILQTVSHVANKQLNVSESSRATLKELSDLALPMLESIRAKQLLEKIKPPFQFTAAYERCMQDTRSDILQSMYEWVDDVDGPNVCWLYGHPGTGKSTIATTLRYELAKQGRLGAACFFRREDAASHDPKSVWLSIASDLSEKHSFIGGHIVQKLLNRTLDIKDADASEIFKELVADSLDAATPGFNGSIVVILDAMDEFGGSDHHNSAQTKLLRTLLPRWTLLSSRFKLLVSSRDQGELSKHLKIDHHRVLPLHVGEATTPQTSSDIRKFFEVSFKDIANRFDGSAWSPTERNIIALTDASAGLFIWASTVVRLVQDCREYLDDVLENLEHGTTAGDTQLDSLNVLYYSILTSACRRRGGETDFRKLCGAIVSARIPLSVNSFASILQMSPIVVEDIVLRLRPVLDSTDKLRFVHKSFVDYLVSPHCPSPSFRCNQKLVECEMTLASFATMERKLHFNMGRMTSSYLFNREVPNLRQIIPEDVRYVSRFWGDHLKSGLESLVDGEAARLGDAISFFFKKRVLYWLEVVSIMDCIAVALGGLAQITQLPQPRFNEIILQARDALSFLRGFSQLISQSYPHIYLSALPFAPSNSILRSQFMAVIPRVLTVLSGADARWPVQLCVMNEHKSIVRSVALSPDGSRLVSGSDDTTVRLWDAATHHPIGEPLQGHTHRVNSVAFSPDGTQIVSGSEDNTIRLWDAGTHHPIGEPLQGHKNGVMSVAFSLDRTQIVSGSKDNTIRVWDATTHHPIGEPLQGHENQVRSVAFSPDGSRIVSGSSDMTIRIWDAATHRPIGEPLKGHENRVNSVTFSPDGAQIVSGSYDATVRLWDAATHHPIGEPLPGHENDVTSVAFSPDGTQIVSGSHDKTIRIWDAATHHPMGEPLQGHEEWITSVVFSPDGAQIVSGSYDKTVRLWDAATHHPTGEPLQGHENRVRSVAFSPDGSRIVSGSSDMTIRIWDAATHRPIGEPLKGHKDWVRSVAFSPDGAQIVSGSNDATVRLWGAASHHPIGEPLQGHENDVLSVEFSPDGTQIVSGSEDNTIRLWDAATHHPIGEPLQGHEHRVNFVAFSPDGTQIVSGSEDNTIRLWDAATHHPIGEPLQGHENGVRSVAFSPDGAQIVSSSDDATVRLWDAATHRPIGEPLQGHKNGVRSVAFSPDGTQIVSSSNDNTVRFWDAATHHPIGEPLRGHDNDTMSVAFSPDGTQIVSGSKDKTIRLWDVPCLTPSHDFDQTLRDFSLSDDFKKEINTNLSDLYGSPTYLLHNGWVVNSSRECLFWIPHHFHLYLLTPGVIGIIGARVPVTFDLSQFHGGASWTLCHS